MIRDFGFSDTLLILNGLKWTVALALMSFLSGSVCGLLVALGRMSRVRLFRIIMTVWIRVFQGTPPLMQLFLVYFGLSILGYGIDPWAAACIGLTMHASAYLGEIWRGCIAAVPVGQTEASLALGLRYIARMRFVVLPQAARIAIAPTVGFLVQLVKATSLTSIIGFVELSRSGQIVSSATFQPMLVFSIVGFLYFMTCWPLSLLARHMERRISKPMRLQK